MCPASGKIRVNKRTQDTLLWFVKPAAPPAALYTAWPPSEYRPRHRLCHSRCAIFILFFQQLWSSRTDNTRLFFDRLCRNGIYLSAMNDKNRLTFPQTNKHTYLWRGSGSARLGGGGAFGFVHLPDSPGTDAASYNIWQQGEKKSPLASCFLRLIYR